MEGGEVGKLKGMRNDVKKRLGWVEVALPLGQCSTSVAKYF